MKFIISKDYSKITGLRYCNISDFSGEDFYHKKLNSIFKEVLDEGDKLELVLDGSEDGFGPSFLDEAIGNLVYDFSLEVVKKHLTIISEQESQWIKMIKDQTFPEWEKRRKEKKEPKVTEYHPAWYRKIGNTIESKIWITPQK